MAFSAYDTTTSALAPSATSSSGDCTSNSPYEGDITYYIAGLGVCGITSDGNTQKVIALPHGLIGIESNNNLYCGKAITITCIATGKTTTATVVDKCLSCEGFSIDLSIAAFLDLEDLSVANQQGYFSCILAASRRPNLMTPTSPSLRNAPLRSFTTFRKLLLELRIQIWRSALEDRGEGALHELLIQANEPPFATV
ncbi:hypothetical protein G7Y89_g12453 [Cudoniella acicularis]|uniref:RlpA-like protein double-psi beta-barrel domain-containing protein n=1 Tax=Cudoniella acicularis TaxID=354080 RepID=A0A8H4RAE6_9HELO|nr:hypothetical protein G7Y89_g12453 [Cudoniella acicularis]